jgi:hypothetical protein
MLSVEVPSTQLRAAQVYVRLLEFVGCGSWFSCAKGSPQLLKQL